MKVGRTIQLLNRHFSGRMYKKNDWRGGHAMFIAEDNQHMGIGRTPAAAVADLRNERPLRAGTYVDNTNI